jgi:hypothetical protein
MNAAREKVRVANALAGLPRISESFSKGELSYSKVRANPPSFCSVPDWPVRIDLQ